MTGSTAVTLSPITAMMLGGTNVMTVLQKAANASANTSNQIELNVITQQLQKQLNQKLTAVQDSVDLSSTNVLQSQINNLTQQKNTFSTIEGQYGANVDLLGDLQTQLASLQTAAAAGDSAGFDAALANANTDVSNLAVATPNPVFEQDGVYALKTQGLGIGSSASYNLATPGGKAAAEAAVSSAQTTVNGIYNVTATNQTLAGQQVTTLDSQIGALNTQLQNTQLDQLTQTTEITTNLKSQMKTEIHLIELQLGQGQQLSQNLQQESTNLQNAETPGSIFSLLA